IPAIIPKSLDDLKEKLEVVSFADRVQIDLVDGDFVENVSWPYKLEGDVRDASDLMGGRVFEIDLMVNNAASMGREWLASGAEALIFHLESLEDFEEAVILR